MNTAARDKENRRAGETKSVLSPVATESLSADVLFSSLGVFSTFLPDIDLDDSSSEVWGSFDEVPDWSVSGFFAEVPGSASGWFVSGLSGSVPGWSVSGLSGSVPGCCY